MLQEKLQILNSDEAYQKYKFQNEVLRKIYYFLIVVYYFIVGLF